MLKLVYCASADTLLHATDPADGSVQHPTQQPVLASSPPGHAPTQPVLHPAGLAAKQCPQVTTPRRMTVSLVSFKRHLLQNGLKSVVFVCRLKQVMNELLCQQQQQSSAASTGWQTQKHSSFQESGCGPSASPGGPVFSSLLNPSANNMATSPMPSFSHSMTFIFNVSVHSKDSTDG